MATSPQQPDPVMAENDFVWKPVAWRSYDFTEPRP